MLLMVASLRTTRGDIRNFATLLFTRLPRKRAPRAAIAATVHTARLRAIGRRASLLSLGRATGVITPRQCARYAAFHDATSRDSDMKRDFYLAACHRRNYSRPLDYRREMILF